MIVLETGVKAGEQVITDGQMMVQPGTPVKVLPPPTSKPVASRIEMPDKAAVEQAVYGGTK
jgi:hypothetical protein